MFMRLNEETTNISDLYSEDTRRLNLRSTSTGHGKNRSVVCIHYTRETKLAIHPYRILKIRHTIYHVREVNREDQFHSLSPEDTEKSSFPIYYVRRSTRSLVLRSTFNHARVIKPATQVHIIRED